MVVAFDWDPAEPNNVYAGTDGGRLFRSEDRGVNWRQLDVGLTTVAVGALAVGSV